MKRIVLIGATGSGKSTLARRVALKLDMPVIEIDDLFWLPGWVKRDPAEVRRLSQVGAAGERWVVTGNYRDLRDIFWTRADTVVWLDYPFYLVFWRLLARSIARIFDKRLICNGNRESFAKLFSKDSIMLWLFNSYWRHRREFTTIIDNPAPWPHITFLRLDSPSATQKWLEGLSS